MVMYVGSLAGGNPKEPSHLQAEGLDPGFLKTRYLTTVDRSSFLEIQRVGRLRRPRILQQAQRHPTSWQTIEANALEL